MFSCIYSPTDNSLTVIGKEDKKLTLLGEWKAHEKTEMKWGKKVYEGTIIKIGDNEDDLTKFANAANRKILPSGKDREEILQDLFSFSSKKAAPETGKRKHVETDRLKESRLQEQESPSKKKKERSASITKPKEKKTVEKKQEISNTPAQIKAVKKRKEEATELIIASEIAELSQQFSTGSGRNGEDVHVNDFAEENNDDLPPSVDNNKSEHQKATSQNAEERKTENHNNMNNLLSEENDLPPSVDNNKSEHQKATSQNAEERKTGNHNLLSEENDVSPHISNTSLTATWQICQNAEKAESQIHNFLPDMPEENAPPSEVIQMFVLLLNPMVQHYMRKMVDRFRNTTQTQHQSVLPPEPVPVYTKPG